MFLEIESTNIKYIKASFFKTDILKLIKHINFETLAILNLNNCSIDNI